MQLFSYCGNGAVTCSEYFNLQSVKILEMREQIKLRVNHLASNLAFQYGILIGEDYLQREIDLSKLNHPYLHAERAEITVDWVNLRSVQRLEEECKIKLQKLLRKAQYILEVSIARILETFWKKLQCMLKGIPKLRTKNTKNEKGFWSLSDADSPYLEEDAPFADSSKAHHQCKYEFC